jgi:hypothetical protein
MSYPPFEAPRAKVGRAERHVDVLGILVRDYAAQKPFGMQQVGSPMLPAYNTVTSIALPDDIPLTIGDAIHNLRSALDIMACDIVRLSGKSTKGVHFPFAGSKDGLQEMIEKHRFNRAPKEAVDLLKKMAPYKGGHIALRAIHDLDIMDKHEMILPVLNQPEHHDIRIGNTRIGRAVMSHTQFEFVGAAPQVGRTVPLLMFAQNLPLAGEQVIPTLKGLCQLVSDTINAFAELMGSRSTKP